MDPQKLASLDPKLRDTYQRVMGTTIPEPPAAPASPQGEPAQAPASDPISNPQPQPPPEPISTPPPAEPNIPPPSDPQPPAPAPAINPQPEPTSTSPASNFAQMNSEVAAPQTFNSPNFAVPAPQSQTMVVKKKSKITPVLFGIVGLIFIAIYTIFWAKILNFKLPFQLPFLQ